jgi:hypothetical protein
MQMFTIRSPQRIRCNLQGRAVDNFGFIGLKTLMTIICRVLPQVLRGLPPGDRLLQVVQDACGTPPSRKPSDPGASTRRKTRQRSPTAAGGCCCSYDEPVDLKSTRKSRNLRHVELLVDLNSLTTSAGIRPAACNVVRSWAGMQ